METSASHCLLSLDVLLAHQESRLAAVRDRIARVAMQQTEMQYRLLWLDQCLDHLQQILNRGTGRR